MTNNIQDYPYLIIKLSEEEGGGCFIEYPDIPGCWSDGETTDEAIKNGRDALKCWIETAKEDGDNIPEPWSHKELEKYSGKFLQRVPKSIHRELIKRSEEEEVSMNQLVTSLISRGLGIMQNDDHTSK